MILISMWLLNFALAAAIIVALLQKWKRSQREKEQRKNNEPKSNAQ